MIVREIYKYPNQVLRKFDYFNDYKDTMSYLGCLPRTNRRDNVIARLEKGYKQYMKRWSERR